VTPTDPLREALTLAGPAGALEALLEGPGDPAPPAIAVVCHPHPLHQGTMLNKVVHSVARALNELGLPTLRFNYRGVGASEGHYADGLGETDDALAAADWLARRYPGAPLWLAGFSFGAVVAWRAASQRPVARLVSIAPPVERMADVIAGLRPACPWLVVQGDADDVVACAGVRDYAARLVPPPELVVLPGVDHFFHGKLSLLNTVLTERLAAGTPHR
jgi:alpha/beta superfamily hydrolase